MIILKGNILIDEDSGEILSNNVKPVFSNYTYEKYVDCYNNTKQVRYLEPMTAQELSEEKLKEVIESGTYVAEEKFDGHRATMSTTPSGNRLFSRRESKKTNWFTENTDCVPHIRDCISDDLWGTIIDGEGTLPIEGCTSSTVQSVTGADPDTAIKWQLEHQLFYEFNAFDILYYKYINVQAMPYWKRKEYLLKVVKELDSDYIKFCPIFSTPDVFSTLKTLLSPSLLNYIKVIADYSDLFAKMLKEGKEGLILKDINAKYEQKRSKSFVKMKAHMMYDVVITGFQEPTRVYEGKNIEDWTYWYHTEMDEIEIGTKHYKESDYFIPVTKPYARGWIGAIEYGVWKKYDLHELIALGISGDIFDSLEDDGIIKCCGKVGKCTDYLMLTKVGECKGITDEFQEYIKTHREELIGQVMEVEAQGIINKEIGSLRHPRYVQMRNDKSSESCTFEAHIREYKK